MTVSRLRILLLFVSTLCVLAGCGLGIPATAPPNRAAAPPPMQAATPLEAARLSTSNPDNRRVLAQRPLEDKVVVFFREPQPATDDQTGAESFWYTVTGRQGAGWSFRNSGGTIGQLITPDGLTEYGVIDVFNEHDKGHAAVMGETQHLDIAAVEVQLANDDVVRDTIANGAFIVIAPQANVAACELRLLAADETVIQTLALPNCEQ